jgi:hypothetical protein
MKSAVYRYVLRPHDHSPAHIAAFLAPPDIGAQSHNRGTPATMFLKSQS